MIRTAWFAAVAVGSTLFFSLVAVIGGLVSARPGWFDWVHRHWSRSLLAAAGVRVTASGLENARSGEARVFVANHQSAFDIWGLLAATPASLRFVAKAELGRIPIFARACRAAGHVFIDREDRRSAMAAVRRAGERMRRDGLSLVLFPEGTRSPDGRLRAFKRGSFALAIETRAPVVPVAIQGGARILGRGDRRIRPGRLRIRFGPAIPTEAMTEADRAVLAERSRRGVAGMLEALEAG